MSLSYAKLTFGKSRVILMLFFEYMLWAKVQGSETISLFLGPVQFFLFLFVVCSHANDHRYHTMVDKYMRRSQVKYFPHHFQTVQGLDDIQKKSLHIIQNLERLSRANGRISKVNISNNQNWQTE